jgi:uncharacterized protein YyaL (SSP411 family)
MTDHNTTTTPATGGHAAADAPALTTNRLAQEVSPYLLQHQHNPVDWWPWGDAALAEAKQRNKPILLSVGYAACHWCHVMAHESFENPDIAKLMNELFINIKVDREERPDLDAIYQQALALLGQQGGWPLTMFLTPDGKPFWGGTYFPPASRWGRPGFPEILRFISDTYAKEPESVAKNVDGLEAAMRKLAQPQSGDAITPDLIDRIADRLVQEVDMIDGGINGAPKFPQVPIFLSFWHGWQRRADSAMRDAVTVTLDAMCQGGIYDHLGGGFARYSTDGKWLVPHFEKMLYDNAALIEILTEVWLETKTKLYADRVAETIGWLEREMLAETDAQGDRAFAASLDADSEGVEGKFYVWSEAEIDALLGKDAPLFKQHYDVTAHGNWEETNILNRRAARLPGSDQDEQLLTLLRGKLLAARSQRVRPGWDDKVLADWNGLMISALVRAASAFDKPQWLELARSAFRFITRNMMPTDKADARRLHHAWRRNKLGSVAMLDDHAHLARAALLLFEATGDKAYLDQAEEFVASLDRHFWDKDNGGYFTAADDVGDVIIRQKTAADNATPSGNGTMVEVLSRLYHLTGKADYARRNMSLVTAFGGEVSRNFFPLATLLNSVDFQLNCLQIVIIGARDDDATDRLLAVIRAQPVPNKLLQVIPSGADLPAYHPATGKEMIEGKPTAYICHGQTCGLPLTDPDALLRALTARAI